MIHTLISSRRYLHVPEMSDGHNCVMSDSCWIHIVDPWYHVDVGPSFQSNHSTTFIAFQLGLGIIRPGLPHCSTNS